MWFSRAPGAAIVVSSIVVSSILASLSFVTSADLALADTALTPIVSAEPDLLNFGILDLGEESDLELTVANVGPEGSILVITGLSATGNLIGFHHPPATPFEIAVGKPVILTVRARALLVGLVIGSVTVESNDPARPAIDVRVDLFGNRPPNCVHGGPYAAPVGAVVQFDGSGSFDQDGSITRYAWRLGGGYTATGPMPTQVYTVARQYPIRLCVTDNRGSESCCYTTADIAGPPVCNAGGPYETRANHPLTFDGSGSIGDGAIVAYDWEFGDGGSGQGVTPTHTYDAVGTYVVTLCVTDEFDFTSCCETQALVNSTNPPECDAGGNYFGTVGEPITFDGSGSNDPDGQIVDYTWYFGDGETATGVSPTHAYANQRSYDVTLCVSDDEGGRSCCTAMAAVWQPGGQPNVLASLVLHAVETDFGPCEIGDPCNETGVTVNVTPGATIAAYLVVSAFDHIGGVQTAFDFGGFTLLANVWDCRSNPINARLPSAPGGPTEGTLSTAFDCVLGNGWRSATIGRMHLVATSGCLSQVESSYPNGTHVVSCLFDETPVHEEARGSICAGSGGIDGCWPQPAVRPSTWGAIKAHYR